MRDVNKAENVLEIRNLEIHYGSNTATSDINFDLRKGEILGIVGESGSGKSTILKSIIGLLDPEATVTSGEIYYKGVDILRVPPSKMRSFRGSEIGMVFQNTDVLCPIRTIGEQVYETVTQHKKIGKIAAKACALDVLAKLGMEDGERLLNSYPFELSGGMNQRVNIMMAMILSPSLLLADEPTSALDVIAQSQVIDEILKAREEYGVSIIIVSHNIGVISRLADKIAVMYRGRIVEYGTKEHVIFHPQNEYTKVLLSSVPRLRRS